MLYMIIRNIVACEKLHCERIYNECDYLKVESVAPRFAIFRGAILMNKTFLKLGECNVSICIIMYVLQLHCTICYLSFIKSIR